MNPLVLIIILSLSHQVKEAVVWVDDFNSTLDDSWKGRNNHYKDIYSIKKQNAKSFLNAKSTDSDNFIVKKIKVDIVQYPYLNWKWRAHSLPVNGDEGVREYCDVGASIAIALNASRLFPKSIKYSWSTELPEGSITKSPYAKWPSKCDIRVMESGSDALGEWKTEKVNILEDYKTFYNKANLKTKKVFAIVIMTDSDNTSTLSEADYDDIYFSKT